MYGDEHHGDAEAELFVESGRGGVADVTAFREVKKRRDQQRDHGQHEQTAELSGALA